MGDRGRHGDIGHPRQGDHGRNQAGSSTSMLPDRLLWCNQRKGRELPDRLVLAGYASRGGGGRGVLGVATTRIHEAVRSPEKKKLPRTKLCVD